MSQLGARLQICNEELVNLIENMRKNLEDIESEIDSDEKQKAILTAQIEELSLSLDKVNESLKEKIAMKNGYCQIVNEAETAYMKILESSQTLISVVKQKHSMLEELKPS